MKTETTREETFQKAYFEWVKTERQGDVCRFKEFVNEQGITYVSFIDGSRVREELIGDVVLMHSDESELVGEQMGFSRVTPVNFVADQINLDRIHPISRNSHSSEIDPVKEIFEKSKKKTEKFSIVLNLKMPTPELYNVIKENFDNTEEILLENLMSQIHDNLLRDALKKEIQNIYHKKKKTYRNGV